MLADGFKILTAAPRAKDRLVRLDGDMIACSWKSWFAASTSTPSTRHC